ncbi:MAG: ATP-binding protein, partial [Chthoniobacteraceae bacterium]
AESPLAARHGVAPVTATFRHILIVVFLIFVFGVVQMFSLWGVCNAGMQTAASLKQHGLPTLNELASLQEHLAIYRLYSYEYLFAQDSERSVKTKAMETVAERTRAALKNLGALLPEGEGRRLVASLEAAIADLRFEFNEVRKLVDSDFPAAMKAMDREIPPHSERVAAAASALKEYGYRFSGDQANATFASFGWIRSNAVAFGAGNILMAVGAIVFVLVAARRSRAQLSETLARLDARTNELDGSLSLVNATLEATADGLLVVDHAGRLVKFNRKFAWMWRVPADSFAAGGDAPAMALAAAQLRDPAAFMQKVRELDAQPHAESFDQLDFKDGRVFERYSYPQKIGGAVVGRVWSFRDITERKRTEAERAEMNRQLVDASRQAGMAEVATSVLHNVGNVLNSVNVSATLAVERVRKSPIEDLARVVALLDEHAADLGAFISHDPRGKRLPSFLSQLSGHLLLERQNLHTELISLRENVDHIKEIVAMQQSNAKVCGVTEVLKITDLVEDSLRLNAGTLSRHQVQVVREFQELPAMTVDKHKVLQILVNLIRNAEYACDEAGVPDKRLTLRVVNGGDTVKISVSDNGVGIAPENLDRIFNHGFTTKKDGHGFGLHSAANAATEIGGRLSVHSDGLGFGATFTLELPGHPSTPSEPSTS